MEAIAILASALLIAFAIIFVRLVYPFWDKMLAKQAKAATRKRDRRRIERRREILRRVMLAIVGTMIVFLGIMFLTTSSPREKREAALAVGGLAFFLMISGFALYISGEFKKPKRDHCKKCGYSLRSNLSGVCPECGTRRRR